MFNKREASNFLKFIKNYPLLAVVTLIDFIILSNQAITQRLNYMLIRDKHTFLRKKPKNVFINELKPKETNHELDIFLSSYLIHKIENKNHKPVEYNVSNDIESYYAENRFAYCINALFENQLDTSIAIEKGLSWIRKPIPKSDKAWEPYSCSERIANFGILLSKTLFKLDAKQKIIIYHFIDEHLYWIDTHLEYYNDKKTNNHILNNCRALIIGGVMINNKFAVERGLLLFDKMASKLILENGFLRERSTHYQVIITNWLLDSLHFANSYKNLTVDSTKALLKLNELSGKVISCTKILINFLKTNTTQIGDISPDYPPSLAIDKLKLLYLGEISSNNLENQYIDNWLFMSIGTNTLISNLVSNNFPLNFPTHGHNDLGSFIWFNDSLPVIVDPGRYSYTTDEISITQLSTKYHNTILIDDLPPVADSLKNGGNWFPFKYANAKIKGSFINENEFIIEHNGFNRINKVGIHKRKFQLIESVLTIEDVIEGEGIHNIALNWNLAPDYTQIPDTEITFKSKSNTLSFHSRQNDNSFYKLSIGNFFLSFEYGQFQESICINTLYKCKLPTNIITTFKIN